MSFSPDTHRDLLRGKMAPPPCQPSSLVRVFVSSDFSGVTAMALSSDYQLLVAGSQDGSMLAWNMEVIEMLHTLPAHSGAVRDTLHTSAQVRCLEIAEQTQLLFTGLKSGTVLIFPQNSRQHTARIPPPESLKPINTTAINKQEKQLATAYNDLVLVLDIAPADPCPAIDGHTYTFYPMRSDFQSGRPHRLQSPLWHDQWGFTPLQLPTIPSISLGHRSQISCLESSHGEQRALSGAEDSLQFLWDLEPSQQEHEMCYYKPTSVLKGIHWACFSKDDRYLYTGSLDQTITVWESTSGALLAVQCVHSAARRIVPAADGFVVTTRRGHIARERLRCARRASAQHNTTAPCTESAGRDGKDRSAAKETLPGA